jgi:hypothetical protein
MGIAEASQEVFAQFAFLKTPSLHEASPETLNPVLQVG